MSGDTSSISRRRVDVQNVEMQKGADGGCGQDSRPEPRR
jgi:hypothetical protein